MTNAWINGNNKKRPNMKLSASKFNENNVFRQFQKKKNFLRCQLYARAYVRIWTLRPCNTYQSEYNYSSHICATDQQLFFFLL